MFVQRVVVASSRRESWTVLGEDGVPIGAVDRYLAYLTDVERSPNTVKAYAHDLKDWFVFLDARGWTGARSDSKTSGSSSLGCGCRRRPGTGGWVCCPRWIATAARRR